MGIFFLYLLRPNPGFWRQLVDYEKNLQTRSSYAPAASSSYGIRDSSSSHTDRSTSYRNDTSIPIQIVSSSRSKPAASSSNFVTSTSNGSYTSSTHIPVYHELSSSYNSRPISASRYDRNYNGPSSSSSSSYNQNPSLTKSSSYKTLEKSYDYDHHSYPSSSFQATRVPSPGQHRSVLVDDPYIKRSANPNPTFSTTYRTSYGRY
jgi:hypothetical protein